MNLGRRQPILVVERDQQDARLLHSLLLQVSGRVHIVRSGLSALDSVVESTYDLVVIGSELPDMTALDLLHHLREITDTPVIVVAREYESDQLVRSLDEGADDYIARPYRPIELAARVRAVLRRAHRREPEPELYVDDQICIDFRSNTVTTPRGRSALSATERSLLMELVANQGRVVTHDDLAARVWGEDYPGSIANLHVFASQLRRKIEPDPAHPVYLHTHRGVGYAFIPADETPELRRLRGKMRSAPGATSHTAQADEELIAAILEQLKERGVQTTDSREESVAPMNGTDRD